MNSKFWVLGLLLAGGLASGVGCGTAKTVYVDSKYKLCMDSCEVQYSKYESSKLSACKAECYKDKREVNK